MSIEEDFECLANTCHCVNHSSALYHRIGERLRTALAESERKREDAERQLSRQKLNGINPYQITMREYGVLEKKLQASEAELKQEREKSARFERIIKQLHKEMLVGYKECPVCGASYPPEAEKKLQASESEKKELAAAMEKGTELIIRGLSRIEERSNRGGISQAALTEMIRVLIRMAKMFRDTKPQARLVQEIEAEGATQYLEKIIAECCGKNPKKIRCKKCASAGVGMGAIKMYEAAALREGGGK